MSYKKFRKQDLLVNTVEANPEQSFYIYDGQIYESQEWPSSSLPVYSFIIKDGNRSNFRTVSTTDYNTNFKYGDMVTGSSYMFVSSSITRAFYSASADRPYISGTLRNVLDYYKVNSVHYAYSSSLGNKETQAINIIEIPSIYYGSSIKKGTVDLKFYVTGTLVGRIQDENNNGELIQTGPTGSTGSGSVAGVCLYREGFLLLTGSWNLTDEAQDYNNNASLVTGSWLYYGAGIEPTFGSGVIHSSSFGLDFKGKNKFSTMTMFCHANSGELNYSNNPTFMAHGQSPQPYVTEKSYKEPQNLQLVNTTKTSYNDPTGSFEKITYISYINIYDEDKNLLGVAKVSKPVKKTEKRDFTFKLKIDHGL